MDEGMGMVLAKYPEWAQCIEEHGESPPDVSVMRGFLIHAWGESEFCVTPYNDSGGAEQILDYDLYPNVHWCIGAEGKDDDYQTRCRVLKSLDKVKAFVAAQWAEADAYLASLERGGENG